MPHVEPILRFLEMNDAQVQLTLKEHKIGLTIEEARKITDILGRNPTLTEATIWGIQGSEHSSYKSSRSYLGQLPTQGPTVILGPKEDAGIVELCTIRGEKYGLVYSHESHNSPSQIVPYEGAATGVGGICRDIACMGARVIGTLDALRFGSLEKNSNKVIANGVIAGIAGYANPLGIPNLGGDMYCNHTFEGYTLVNVVALGLVKEKNILHSYCPQEAGKVGYDLIVVGKPSDQSGFGGASFSSAVVDESKKEENKGAVQEPNPFLERHLFASMNDLYRILEQQNLLSKVACKDMGAGGIMCATVELAEGAGFGAEIQVENIHVGEDGLPPHVIFCSETQERFCFAVHPDLTPMVLEHFNTKWDLPSIAYNARASRVGKVTEGGIFKVTYHGETICEARATDITAGIRYDRPVQAPQKSFAEITYQFPADITPLIEQLLTSENIASTKCVSENYDQTVQGNTVLMRSQSEAGVIAPLRDEEHLTEEEKQHGFAVAVAGHPRFGKISPYEQGVHAVVSALQRVAATGAIPAALTDCLNYGNPEAPEQMWEFAEGVRGVATAAKGIKLFQDKTSSTPFVSGNVSLYKPCSPSAIVSCVGTLEDVDEAIGNIPQNMGNSIYLVGRRSGKLGGSEFAALQRAWEGHIPEIDLKITEKELHFVLAAAQKKLFCSSAVTQVGGLVATLCKMCFRGNVGFFGDLANLEASELLSEDAGFLLEVEDRENFEKFAKEHGVEAQKLGEFTEPERIVGGNFSLDFSKSKKLWEEGLRKKLS